MVVAVLEKIHKSLDGLHPVRALGLTKEELELIQPLQLLTAKPALYIANVDEAALRSGTAYLKQLQD